jgi:hypothetical protein
MTKNITLNAEEKLIELARKRAQEEHKSLNIVFRDWLFRYAHGYKQNKHYDTLMKKYSYANAGRHFSREEMNER